MWILLDGAAWLALTFLGLCLISLYLDWEMRMDVAQRIMILVAAVGVLGWVLVRRMVRPMFQALPDDLLLIKVEGRHPELGESVISAAEFSRLDDPVRLGISPSMVAAAIRDGLGRATTVRFTDVVDSRRRNINLLLLVGAVVVFLGAVGTMAAVSPQSLWIWFNRNIMLGNEKWPTQTQLVVLDCRGVGPGEEIVDSRDVFAGEAGKVKRQMARGDTWKLHVLAKGVIPQNVRIEFRFEDGSEDVGDANNFSPDADTSQDTGAGAAPNGSEEPKLTPWFVYTEDDGMRSPFEFRVIGNDYVSEWMPMAMRDRPSMYEVGVKLIPPDYTGEPPRTLSLQESSHAVYPGSSLEVSGRANKPLKRAWLRTSDGREVSLSVGGETTHTIMREDGERETKPAWSVSGKLTPDQLAPGTYAFSLLSEDDMRESNPRQFTLRSKTDRSPKLTCRLDGVSSVVVSNAMIPIDMRITDEFAVTRVRLGYRRELALMDADPDAAAAPAEGADAGGDVDEPSEPPAQPAAEETWTYVELDGIEDLGTDDVRHLHVFDLENLEPRLQVGETVQFRVEAFDNDDVNPDKEPGVSTVFMVRVVEREVLLNELVRREQRQGREFDNVVSDEEEMLTDTAVIGADIDSRQKVTPGQISDLVKLEKRQRQVSRRLNIISRQFEAILKEFENNRLESAESTVRERLSKSIIAPMDAIAAEAVPYASDQLDTAAQPRTGLGERSNALTEATRVQRLILQDMKKIRTQMLKWEQYQDAVRLIRAAKEETVDLKTDIEAEMEEIRRREAERIFGPLGGG